MEVRFVRESSSSKQGGGNVQGRFLERSGAAYKQRRPPVPVWQKIDGGKLRKRQASNRNHGCGLKPAIWVLRPLQGICVPRVSLRLLAVGLGNFLEVASIAGHASTPQLSSKEAYLEPENHCWRYIGLGWSRWPKFGAMLCVVTHCLWCSCCGPGCCGAGTLSKYLDTKSWGPLSKPWL